MYFEHNGLGFLFILRGDYGLFDVRHMLVFKLHLQVRQVKAKIYTISIQFENPITNIKTNVSLNIFITEKSEMREEELYNQIKDGS